MKLFFHYCTIGFSNCYIIGTDKPEAASNDVEHISVIIDPGCMDEGILSLIEQNNYKLKAVLITHDHQSHTYGIRALQRIYDFDVYAAKSSVLEHDAIVVRDEDSFDIGPMHFDVLSIPGHSADSVVYSYKNMLFTGDVLSAGLIGSTSSTYGSQIQATALQNKLFTLPGNQLVMPGHGPPSSLDIERKFNAGMKFFEIDRHRYHRKNFTTEFLE
jgi:glyoxylase-like metal-dependent hydrolase (beta-lactamase superfamily II)